MKLRPIVTVSLFDGNQSKEIKGNVRRWKKFPFKISIHPFVDLIDTGVQGVSIIRYNFQTAASGWKNELKMKLQSVRYTWTWPISRLKSRLLENRICKFADYLCIELILRKFCSAALNLLSIVYSSNLHILNKFVVWNNFISTCLFI